MEGNWPDKKWFILDIEWLETYFNKRGEGFYNPILQKNQGKQIQAVIHCLLQLLVIRRRD